MKLGAFLKQYLKQSLQVFKHPKQMLPTIILTVVWIALGILQIKLKENLPMKVLNFLTYAQGGLYGGIFGAIGGILGKVVVAAFVNALIVPLFSGKKSFDSLGAGFKELRKQISFNSKEALAPLLKGLGAAMLIYILFNITARFENSMAGIMAAVSFALALGRKNGFMWDLAFSYANSVSKGKAPSYQNVLRGITGMSLGFALAVALSAFAPSLVSLLGIVALIVGWVFGKGTKKEAAAILSLLLLFTLSQQELRAQDEPSAASSEGTWVLVDKKTTLSSSSYDSGDYDAGNGVLNRVVIENVSGTVEHFEFDGDFIIRTPRSWTGGTGYDEASHNKSHAEAAVTPFEGPYRPGEVFEAHYNGKVNGPNIMQIYSNIHLQIFLSYYPGKSATASWQFPNGDDQYWSFTFPTVEEAKGERFTISYRIQLVEVVLQIDYIFEWGGGNEILVAPDWVKELLGDEGEHANEVWTVFVSLVGGLMGGGLLGGAGGAAAGGGGLFPDGPGFLSPEDERRRRFLTENGDGTRTLEDPATGKRYTLYPTYDEDGNRTGWKNENDTPYDEAGIDEWLDWRERNSSAFSQDEATAEKNLEDWRKRNEELKNKDREAYNKETKAIEAQRKREDYIEKMADEYYVGYNSSVDSKQRENDIKKEMIKEMQDAETESAQNTLEEYEASWNQAYMETYQKVCDTGVTIGAQVAPGGKAVQTYYSLAKNGLGRGMEARATGGSFVKGLAAGSVEGGLEVLQNNANVMGDAAGSKLVEYGTQVGAGVIKEAFTGWYEGKSVEETVKEMRNSAIGEAVKIGTGKLIEKGVKSVNAGYQGSGYVYGSMYREGVEGAITKNIELGQQLSETFNTGFDVTMTWIKD